MPAIGVRPPFLMFVAVRAIAPALQREFLHPAPGAPRYLAVYEADDASLKRRADRAANPGGYAALSSGPPAWETHDTLWRLWYRRIDSLTK